MTTATDLVHKVDEVSQAIAFQSGTGALECAGMIMSCLARYPDLVERFMTEGSGLIVSGEISVGRGLFSYHAIDGSVRPAKTAAITDQLRDIKRKVTNYQGPKNV